MQIPSFRAVRAALVLAAVFASLSCGLAVAQPYFVSPTGDDANPGSLAKPFASLHRAQLAVRQKRGDVYLRGGTYYLNEPLVFTAADSGAKDAPVVYRNFQNERVVISGGLRRDPLDWRPGKRGIFRARVPKEIRTEELFVNGEQQVLARYPNFDPHAKYFNGYAADAIAPERVARWSDPAGGYFHAMHPALWGDFTWRILGKDAEGHLRLEGGWQSGRLGN